MYDNLGIRWASAIPAFLALMCTPFPFLFYKYGPAIRKRCKFAAEAAQFMERMRGQTMAKEQEAPVSDDMASSTDEPITVDEKEDEKEREADAEAEAEAVDYSYEDEAGVAAHDRFRSIRPGGVKRTATNNSYSGRQSVDYEASPYDIDRVHTNEFFRLGRSISRSATSRPASIKSGRESKMF